MKKKMKRNTYSYFNEQPSLILALNLSFYNFI